MFAAGAAEYGTENGTGGRSRVLVRLMAVAYRPNAVPRSTTVWDDTALGRPLRGRVGETADGQVSTRHLCGMSLRHRGMRLAPIGVSFDLGLVPMCTS